MSSALAEIRHFKRVLATPALSPAQLSVIQSDFLSRLKHFPNVGDVATIFNEICKQRIRLRDDAAREKSEPGRKSARRKKDFHQDFSSISVYGESKPNNLIPFQKLAERVNDHIRSQPADLHPRSCLGLLRNFTKLCFEAHGAGHQDEEDGVAESTEQKTNELSYELCEKNLRYLGLSLQESHQRLSSRDLLEWVDLLLELQERDGDAPNFMRFGLERLLENHSEMLYRFGFSELLKFAAHTSRMMTPSCLMKHVASKIERRKDDKVQGYTKDDLFHLLELIGNYANETPDFKRSALLVIVMNQFQTRMHRDDAIVVSQIKNPIYREREELIRQAKAAGRDKVFSVKEDAMMLPMRSSGGPTVVPASNHTTTSLNPLHSSALRTFRAQKFEILSTEEYLQVLEGFAHIGFVDEWFLLKVWDHIEIIIEEAKAKDEEEMGSLGGPMQKFSSKTLKEMGITFDFIHRILAASARLQTSAGVCVLTALCDILHERPGMVRDQPFAKRFESLKGFIAANVSISKKVTTLLSHMTEKDLFISRQDAWKAAHTTKTMRHEASKRSKRRRGDVSSEDSEADDQHTGDTKMKATRRHRMERRFANSTSGKNVHDPDGGEDTAEDDGALEGLSGVDLASYCELANQCVGGSSSLSSKTSQLYLAEFCKNPLETIKDWELEDLSNLLLFFVNQEMGMKSNTGFLHSVEKIHAFWTLVICTARAFNVNNSLPYLERLEIRDQVMFSLHLFRSLLRDASSEEIGLSLEEGDGSYYVVNDASRAHGDEESGPLHGDRDTIINSIDNNKQSFRATKNVGHRHTSHLMMRESTTATGPDSLCNNDNDGFNALMTLPSTEVDQYAEQMESVFVEMVSNSPLLFSQALDSMTCIHETAYQEIPKEKKDNEVMKRQVYAALVDMGTGVRYRNILSMYPRMLVVATQI